MLNRRNVVHGFTLVELLVVIAIIGMLVGILLPAVNAARDAGRRTQNANNLKNIGLAVVNYHESKSSYPPLRLVRDEESRKAGKDYPIARQSVSWAFELLPFLEQGNVYDRFDKTRSVHDQANAIAMRTPLEIYTNPRQRTDPSANCVFPGADPSDPSAPRGTCIDYAANRGFYNRATAGTDQFTMKFNPRNVGPFVHNALVTSAHVRDGLSSTLSIGDRWIGPQDPDQAGLAAMSSSTIMRGPMGEVADGSVRVEPPFPVSNNDPSIDKFGGPRSSGTNACFVYLDGHNEWLDYSMDPIVFRAICTIDGGEVVPD